MTRKEAKNELRPIRAMGSKIRSIELEIERLDTIATKMTPTYDSNKVSGGYRNKIEEAVIKKEEYRGRLAKILLNELDLKNRCLNKIEKIEQDSLQQILILYYYRGMTMEKVSEVMDKSPRWTYELFCAALDEYAKISDDFF